MRLVSFNYRTRVLIMIVYNIHNVHGLKLYIHFDMMESANHAAAQPERIRQERSKMEVNSNGACKDCKHCMTFNHKEGLAVCVEYYNLKDVPRGSICFEGGTKNVLDCYAKSNKKGVH